MYLKCTYEDLDETKIFHFGELNDDEYQYVLEWFKSNVPLPIFEKELFEEWDEEDDLHRRFIQHSDLSGENYMTRGGLWSKGVHLLPPGVNMSLKNNDLALKAFLTFC